MIRRDLNHTINRRAMAGIIVALCVEIAARRGLHGCMAADGEH